MFIDDNKVTLEVKPQSSVTSAPSGSVDLFVDQLTGHFYQIDSSGNQIDLAYPSYLYYCIYAWDCDSIATASNITSWQNSTISSGTVVLATQSISSGTPTSSQALDMANHPGVVSITSSTTANSGAQCTWGGTTLGFLLKAGLVFDCVFCLISTTNSTFRLGFHDASTAFDAVDGAYIEIPPGGVAVGKISSNSTRVSAGATISLSIATWYHARVEILTATSAKFTIFSMAGVELYNQTVNGTLPTANGRECQPRFIATNSTTTATFIAQLDFVSWRGIMNRGATS